MAASSPEDSERALESCGPAAGTAGKGVGGGDDGGGSSENTPLLLGGEAQRQDVEAQNEGESQSCCTGKLRGYFRAFQNLFLGNTTDSTLSTVIVVLLAICLLGFCVYFGGTYILCFGPYAETFGEE
jgi:hypothetical protein